MAQNQAPHTLGIVVVGPRMLQFGDLRTSLLILLSLSFCLWVCHVRRLLCTGLGLARRRVLWQGPHRIILSAFSRR